MEAELESRAELVRLNEALMEKRSSVTELGHLLEHATAAKG